MMDRLWMDAQCQVTVSSLGHGGNNITFVFEIEKKGCAIAATDDLSLSGRLVC